MTHIASRLASARVAGLLTLAAAGGTVALAAGSAASAATPTVAPTLAVGFTPSEIGVLSGSSTITYTIANPNASTLSGVGFSDTLPTGVVVDNPANVTVSGCGTPAVSAGPSYASDSAVGISIKANTSCTVSISVVPTAAGDSPDTLGPLTYTSSGATNTAPTSNETPASLDVLAAPTATITSPRNNAVYSYGEKVAAQYTCGAPDDANGSTLSACLGADDLGNPVDSGQDIDTTTPGKHYLQVQSIDNDGDSVNAQVNYTVLPDNLVVLKSATSAKGGVLHTKLAVPGAGKLKLTEVDAKTTVASDTVKVAEAKKALSVTLTPTAAGKKLLAASKTLKVKLKVSFTPKGGKQHTITRVETLKGA